MIFQHIRTLKVQTKTISILEPYGSPRVPGISPFVIEGVKNSHHHESREASCCSRISVVVWPPEDWCLASGYQMYASTAFLMLQWNGGVVPYRKCSAGSPCSITPTVSLFLSLLPQVFPSSSALHEQSLCCQNGWGLAFLFPNAPTYSSKQTEFTLDFFIFVVLLFLKEKPNSVFTFFVRPKYTLEAW